MDLVLVSTDSVAADAVAAELMGISPKEIPHLRICAERGLGEIDTDKIFVNKSDWRDLCKKFERPPTNLSISYPNIVVHDKNSCSACQSSLYLFLKRYGNTLGDYCSESEPLHLAIGKANIKFTIRNNMYW